MSKAILRTGKLKLKLKPRLLALARSAGISACCMHCHANADKPLLMLLLLHDSTEQEHSSHSLPNDLPPKMPRLQSSA